MQQSPKPSSSRARDFKKGVSADDNRRRREANVNAIRKDKKEDGLSKRRNISLDDTNGGNSTDISIITEIGVITDATMKKPSIADIPTFLAGLASSDGTTQLNSLRGFRKLLSLEKNAPIQECIDCGSIPILISYLQRADRTDLQFEAAWALTNIASTDQTEIIVQNGAIPYLVQLLLSSSPDVREQVLTFAYSFILI